MALFGRIFDPAQSATGCNVMQRDAALPRFLAPGMRTLLNATQCIAIAKERNHGGRLSRHARVTKRTQKAISYPRACGRYFQPAAPPHTGAPADSVIMACIPAAITSCARRPSRCVEGKGAPVRQ